MKFEVVEKILTGDRQRQRYKQILHSTKSCESFCQFVQTSYPGNRDFFPLPVYAWWLSDLLNHKLRYAITERPINIMVLGDSYQYIFRWDAWIDSQILHYSLVKRLL